MHVKYIPAVYHFLPFGSLQSDRMLALSLRFVASKPLSIRLTLSNLYYVRVRVFVCRHLNTDRTRMYSSVLYPFV